MDKKSKITIIISIIGLALVLITITYAYFAANITGIESASTISLNAGTMSIVYSEGDGAITANNMFPREEAWVTKTFTLTGNNTTNQPMKYELKLNVTSNTFPDDYLTYDLTLVSSTSGTPIASKTNQSINGTGDIRIGTGSFVNAVNDTHNYELKIYFKDNGLDQSDALGAVFNAKIVVSEYVEPAPLGWGTAQNGTLLAGIRENYPVVAAPLSTPGKSLSLFTFDDINDSTFYSTYSYQDYYWTYADDFEQLVNGKFKLVNPQTCMYSSCYDNLVGKYLVSYDRNVGANKTGDVIVSEQDTIVKVISATSSSINYEESNSMNITEKVLAATQDDYGTSYYYRGTVENNYVVFANMCWRIVRIDGAGNTKLLLYNYNPNNVANPCSTSEDGKTKAFARYNNAYQSIFNTNYNKNTHVGFMYSSNPDSSDFNIAHANDNDSTILTFLKNWYDEKLRGYNDMLADVIWCNDKSIVTDTTYDPWKFGGIQGTGLGTDKTYYGATYRLKTASSAAPSLVCPSAGSDGKLSKFTARDAINGNAKLYSNNKEYKIGLLTADEVAFAGTISDSKVANKAYYLYKNTYPSGTGGWIWSLTPTYFKGGYARVWHTSDYGDLGSYYVNYGDNSGGVRPAIALKSNVTISGGNGTQASPFVIAS